MPVGGHEAIHGAEANLNAMNTVKPSGARQMAVVEGGLEWKKHENRFIPRKGLRPTGIR